MLGMKFHIMKKTGKCQSCFKNIVVGEKSVVLGDFTNTHRYCTTCFLQQIESEFVVEILDFIGDKNDT